MEKLRAVFEIEFESPEAVRKALAAVRQKNPVSVKAALAYAVNKSVLRATITAKGFAPLRALSSSFLRDVRVFLDSLEVVKKNAAASASKAR